jgi:hypothetical protein
MKILLLLLAVSAGAVHCSPVYSGPLDETRYCGTPVRDSGGTIIRSPAVVAAFKKTHPCPDTGRSVGACPGWEVDHVIPLACGGCDAVSNMQWLPIGIKTAPTIGKDRFERKIYGGRVDNTPACSAPPIHE